MIYTRDETNGMVLQKGIKLIGVVSIFLFLFSSVSATELFGYGETKDLDPSNIVPGTNYSINVNNTDFFRGYTPATLRDWMQTTYDGLYCRLTGCTMTGDIDMDGNDINNLGDLDVIGDIDVGGNITVDGYVNATMFYGNGSQLTDLPSSVDTSAYVNCSTDEVFLGNGSCMSSSGFGTTPAGTDRDIQFNDGGAFGADTSFEWGGANIGLTAKTSGTTAGTFNSFANTLTGTTSEIFGTNIGVSNILTNDQDVTGTIFLSSYSNKPAYNFALITNDNDVVSDIVMGETSYGLHNRILDKDRTLSMSGAGSQQFAYWAINNQVEVKNTYDSAGHSIDFEIMGTKTDASYSGDVDAGTANVELYGEWIQAIDTSTDAGVTSTAYGLFIQSVSGDEEWAIYVNKNILNSFLGGDNSKIILGTAKDASIYYDGTDMIIDPKEVGSGSLKVNGDLNVTENLEVGGNITGNQIYGGMYYHNHTATDLNFAVQDTWYPLFFTDADKLNGFTYVGGFGLSSNLTAQVSGTYQASYMGIGSGRNNHVYLTTILINGVEQEKCGSHHKMAAGGDVITQGSTCLIDISVGNTVSVATQDMGGTGTGTYYGGNLNLVRVGS